VPRKNKVENGNKKNTKMITFYSMVREGWSGRDRYGLLKMFDPQEIETRFGVKSFKSYSNG